MAGELAVNDQTIDGIEASRRAGWAKYYEADDECALLKATLDSVLIDFERFALRVMNSEAVIVLDLALYRQAEKALDISRRRRD